MTFSWMRVAIVYRTDTKCHFSAEEDVLKHIYTYMVVCGNERTTVFCVFHEKERCVKSSRRLRVSKPT